MSENRFENLLATLPKIADAVNKFESETLQQQAFAALMEALGIKGSRPAKGGSGTAANEKPKRKPAGPSEKSEKSPSRKKATPSLVKDLDLRPKEKPAFRDFVGTKKVASNYDRNAVTVYYLERILEIEAVTADHVFTAYRDVGWRVPSDLKNSLALTSNKKGWIDTSKLEDLKMTVPGLNAVEHDLVVEEKS